MFKFLRVKRRFGTDLVFAIVSGMLYWGFYSKLPAVRSEVNVLFIATYIFLGLGILILYLASEMNPKFASIVHVGFFPLASIVFLFSKWLPTVIPSVRGLESALSLGILAYVLSLFAYFNIQLYIHREEPAPEKIREFRSASR